MLAIRMSNLMIDHHQMTVECSMAEGIVGMTIQWIFSVLMLLWDSYQLLN